MATHPHLGATRPRVGICLSRLDALTSKYISITNRSIANLGYRPPSWQCRREDASPPSEDASPPIRNNKSQPNNQSILLASCCPYGSVRVSTGRWKHVHWPVETRTLASGRQRNVHILTTEAHKIDSKASVFPTSLARSKEKLTHHFFIFLQYFRIF